MTRYIKIFAIAAAATMLHASPAFAEQRPVADDPSPKLPAISAPTTVSIAFKYDAALSANDNYKALKTIVRRACRADQPAVSASLHGKPRRQCRAELLDKVVSATGRPGLAALHGGAVPAANAVR